MSTKTLNVETGQIVVSGQVVDIVRKSIKNLHLGVYPPSGRVRVAAPLAVSDDAVRLAVSTKLGWIRRQQAKFAAQPRQDKREMVSGESHYFLGRRYRLRVLNTEGAAKVVLSKSCLELHVRRDMSTEGKERVLQEWYRQELKRMAPPLLEKWQAAMGVEAARWGVRKMKTRWGSCNTQAGRIWLNLELAKKPLPCLEYILVHELAHLIERNHNATFIGLMEHFLPQWRLRREILNTEPLKYLEWDY